MCILHMLKDTFLLGTAQLESDRYKYMYNEKAKLDIVYILNSQWTCSKNELTSLNI